MNETLKTFTDVIDCFPNYPWLGERLDVSSSAISNMRNRDSVDGKYFLGLTQAAAEIGRADITFELLAMLAARRKTAASST